MRRLGLLGYRDPKVAMSYHRAIAQRVTERTDGSLDPAVTIENLPGLLITRSVGANPSEELTAHLLEGIERLAAAGCEIAALSSVDAHAVYPLLVQRSPIPLVSVVEATRDKLRRKGHKRVMLLGTVPAMRDAFFKGLLAKAGMLVLAPGGADRAWLGKVISNELTRGVASEETAARFTRLVEDGAEHGVDAIVLGCPELRLLTDRLSLDIPVVDAREVHVRALVDAILEEDQS